MGKLTTLSASLLFIHHGSHNNNSNNKAKQQSNDSWGTPYLSMKYRSRNLSTDTSSFIIHLFLGILDVFIILLSKILSYAMILRLRVPLTHSSAYFIIWLPSATNSEGKWMFAKMDNFRIQKNQKNAIEKEMLNVTLQNILSEYQDFRPSIQGLS
ncbi:hypothetical protein BDA99DRAFT_543856 [Phascolomyces articulosus]|uniref:Uncharacterized protein n=1 Tax=Phascolomyces articulosus TaxID=60185 RepID=A0AAD5JX01_9FUNG|nr:hypothetical protein BDA99DRAFT_543856 [Phascolomyces articulosus]